ncbi:MAG: hypothetical protein NT039_03900, partial [Candidatus Berkelbacteria bacterium]|nr:hypothetical protein [Candidatus Berkelbacteria bacterium]
LLDREGKDLSKIKKEYKKSLSKKEIEPDLKIDIKNFCDNLRSALDYLANEIVVIYCPKANPKDKLYFPISTTKASFNERMKRSYPGLEVNCKDLYSYLLSLQPFQRAENKWILDFNELNIKNKHNDLVEQVKKETKRINVKIEDSVSVNWDPSSVRFGQGVYIGGVPINPNTQMPVPSSTQKVEIVTWIDFKFEGIDVSASWLLRESLKRVKRIYKKCGEWIYTKV